MSDDLIKRDDALNACVLREDNPPTEMQLSLRNVISALPTVPTHSYAGESEASVYDRKGFPPIEIVNDPAAIREAALQDRIEQLERENARLDAGWTDANARALAARLEVIKADTVEAKLAKAVESIKQSIKLWEKSDGGDRERRLDNAYDGFELLCLALAELEGGE
jgi:hypothetical protein